MRHRDWTLEDWLELAADAATLLLLVALGIALVIAIAAMLGILVAAW